MYKKKTTLSSQIITLIYTERALTPHEVAPKCPYNLKSPNLKERGEQDKQSREPFSNSYVIIKDFLQVILGTEKDVLKRMTD